MSKLDAEIKRIEAMDEDYIGHNREMIRDLIISSAFTAAFDIIYEYSEGEAEYRYASAALANKLVDKIVSFTTTDILKVDLQNREKEKTVS
jgi:hypothetical protein